MRQGLHAARQQAAFGTASHGLQMFQHYYFFALPSCLPKRLELAGMAQRLSVPAVARCALLLAWRNPRCPALRHLITHSLGLDMLARR